MQNYYELLKLEPDASETEIESRLDDQYTKWRSLVTHHDTTVVSQANQALHTLEEIRTTLLNPQSRATYNKLLSGERDNLGGLADPDIVLAQNPMTAGMAPPRPRNTPQTISSSDLERTDAWICTDPKCRKANQIGTTFCAKCGKRVGFKCPSCGSLVELSNKFCTSCGVNKEETFKKMQADQISSLQKQVNNFLAEIHQGEVDYKSLLEKHPEIVTSTRMGGCAGAILAIVAIILGIGIGIGSESAFVGFLIGGGFWAGVLVISQVLYNNKRKEMVQELIESKLKPQIRDLKQEILKVQNEHYGETGTLSESFDF